jgi:hypothetical protein
LKLVSSNNASLETHNHCVPRLCITTKYRRATLDKTVVYCRHGKSAEDSGDDTGEAFPSLLALRLQTHGAQCNASVARKRVCEQITGEEYRTYAGQVQREVKSADRLHFFPTSQYEKLSVSNLDELQFLKLAKTLNKKLCGLSPRANYTDRETADYQRS